MDSKSDRKPSEKPQADERTTTSKKRFRIEKVEERVAPKKPSNSSNSGSGYTLSVGGY
jgi:hypothetical protein